MSVTPRFRRHADFFGKLPLEVGLVVDADHFPDHGDRQVGIYQQQPLRLADPEFLAPGQDRDVPPEPYIDIQTGHGDTDISGNFFDRRQGLDEAFLLHPDIHGPAYLHQHTELQAGKNRKPEELVR